MPANPLFPEKPGPFTESPTPVSPLFADISGTSVTPKRRFDEPGPAPTRPESMPIFPVEPLPATSAAPATVVTPLLPVDSLAAPPAGETRLGAAPVLPREPLNTPLPARRASPPEVAAALPPDSLATPPASSRSTAPVLAPQPLAAPPISRVPEKAAAAFGDTLDGLAGRAATWLQGQYPRASATDWAHWRGVLGQLFPLTTDTLHLIGRRILEESPLLVSQVSQVSEAFTRMDMAARLQRLVDAARQQADAGNAGLLGKLEARLHHFDVPGALQQLAVMQSEIGLLRGKLSPLRTALQECLTEYPRELPLCDALGQIYGEANAEGNAIARRKELLIAAGQQLQFAEKQLGLLDTQTAQSLENIETFRTVGLPGLGFLNAMQH